MDLISAAEKEMHEEIGLSVKDLENGTLKRIGAYEYYEKKPEINYFDREYKEIFYF